MEYFAQTGDKEPVGFDVDMVKALAESWKAKPEIVTMDFSGLLPGLEAKRCDAVISGIFLNKERQKNFDGVGYLSTASVLIGKGGEATIASTDGLSGKTVAVQTGTEYVKWMDEINAGLKAKNKPPAVAQLYPKASDVIQQVLLGRAYAGFTQDTEVAFRNMQNPGKLTTIYTFPERQIFAIYVRREGSNLDEVTKAVSALRANGALAAAIKKWNLAPGQLDVPK